MKLGLNFKRRLSVRVIGQVLGVIAIAAFAGYFVQSVSQNQMAARQAEAALAAAKPKEVTSLAAESETVLPQILPAPTASSLSGASIDPNTAIVQTEPNGATTTTLDPSLPPTGTAIAADGCQQSLELIEEEFSMIGLTLLAPCHANERVVLRHAGLSVTALTNAAGSLFVSIPALQSKANVDVMLKDGSFVSAVIDIPSVAKVHRFAVQWQANDDFQLHAFEGALVYGAADHVSAAQPNLPVPGLPHTGGFLTQLGDPSTELQMYAQVYTFPVNAPQKPEVIVEASVTGNTCGRELLGETITSVGGDVYITDLTVSMPDCTAIGDYLVLKNLVPELNITASN
jgi:hypothetical protein